SSALTSARKSRYNATSSGRARRISSRSPPGLVLCNSLEPESPLFGIGAASAPCTSMKSGFKPINDGKQTHDRHSFQRDRVASTAGAKSVGVIARETVCAGLRWTAGKGALWGTAGGPQAVRPTLPPSPRKGDVRCPFAGLPPLFWRLLSLPARCSWLDGGED